MIGILVFALVVVFVVLAVRRSRQPVTPQRPGTTAPRRSPDLACGPVWVLDGFVHHGQMRFPVAGARAAIETAGSLEKRVTMTRLALIGVFAFAAQKKNDTRMIYLTVASPEGFMIQAPFITSVEQQARNFVVAFNNMSALASAQGGSAPGITAG